MALPTRFEKTCSMRSRSHCTHVSTRPGSTCSRRSFSVASTAWLSSTSCSRSWAPCCSWRSTSVPAWKRARSSRSWMRWFIRWAERSMEFSRDSTWVGAVEGMPRRMSAVDVVSAESGLRRSCATMASSSSRERASAFASEYSRARSSACPHWCASPSHEGAIVWIEGAELAEREHQTAPKPRARGERQGHARAPHRVDGGHRGEGGLLLGGLDVDRLVAGNGQCTAASARWPAAGGSP